jgi:hypothetical protein
MMPVLVNMNTGRPQERTTGVQFRFVGTGLNLVGLGGSYTAVGRGSARILSARHRAAGANGISNYHQEAAYVGYLPSLRRCPYHR